MVTWRPESNDKRKCECGHCDKWIPKYNNWGRENHFAFGHSKTKVKKDNPEKDCECGCGGKILTYDKSGKERHFIMNHNKRKTITKDKEYEYVYAPDHPNKNHRNKVYKHRLIAEEYLSKKIGLKIYLGRSILIHHIDENPHNNDVSNLMIVTRGLHQTIHKTKDMTNRKCCYCDSSETYKGKDGYYKWYRDGDRFFCRKCRWRIKKE